MNCPKCESPLKFRRWSDRLPVKSEALADCTGCAEKWQIRYWDGKPSSAPYQVSPCKAKARRGSWRLRREREAAIVAMWGSVQNYLDNSPLVCMSMQYKT